MNYGNSSIEQSHDDDANKMEIANGTETMEEAIEAMEEAIEAPLHYRRLTFISMNACDFCTHVTTPGPYMQYLSF